MSTPQLPIVSDLRVDALTLSRGGRVLVRDLSFALKPGDALILTGANGSGKTTLLRAIASLVRPDNGVITAPASSYLGHADGLKASETVLEVLRFWAGMDASAAPDDDAARIDDIASALGVRPLYLTSCRHLSAGQKRRVALARMALKRDAALWLMDEPAAPLDTQGKALLADMVAGFRQRGGMVIAATHADLGWKDTQFAEIGA
ncbi:MAG: ABC-type heme export system ATPase component CcmA [Oceanicaulis sp. HLUCCA04]|nr:MAG: ABC-type heme export system ATPase component CcmA [Oceanicaulis sp. HLUCCA04]